MKSIVIDGIDGAGKYTQFKLLSEYLSSKGYIVKTADFPAYDEISSTFVKGHLYETIPDDNNPYAVSMMYALDRYLYCCAHPEFKIAMAAPIDGFMLINRYTPSNIVFQISQKGLSNTQGAQIAEFIWQTEHLKFDIPTPDLVIILDLPIDISIKLKSEQRKNGHHGPMDVNERDEELQERVRQNMIKIVPNYYRSIIIPCFDESTGSIKSKNAIHEEIKQAISSKLKITL